MKEILENACNQYNAEMEKVYEQLFLMKESNSDEDYTILLEGFFSTLKNMAFGAGKFTGAAVKAVTSGVEKMKDTAKSIWDKGVELGTKAVEIGKKLIDEISSVISSSIEAIKKAPEKFWDSVKLLSSNIADETVKIYKKAEAQGKAMLDVAKKTVADIYSKLSAGIMSVVKDLDAWSKKNADAFSKMISEKKAELKEIASEMSKSASKLMAVIGNNLLKALEKGGEYAKYAGIFIIGVAVAPIYGAYKLGVKTLEAGKAGAKIAADYTTIANKAIVDSVHTVKKEVPDVWKAAVEGFKAGTSESFVMNFEQFLNERYEY